MIRAVLSFLTYLLMAAHLLFHGFGVAIAAASLLPLALLFVRRKEADFAQAALTFICAAEWLRTTCALVEVRLAHGADWKLAALILSGCALLSLATAALHFRRFRRT